jgi:NADPH:quinone reductase-like Zn-dependent oxidoreductase
VLIRVQAGVVTSSDTAFRQGDPFIVRLIYGLRKPRIAIHGVEFSGVVEAVGAAVKNFRPGDALYGVSPDRFGAHAEYMCVAETKPMTLKPAGMSHIEAASIADGAPTALTFLRDVAKVQPGQRVLINGASGAVGSYAVQLAKHFGAEVTAICSGGNATMVRALGADHVVDYTREDFTRKGKQYDVIFDAVGKRSFAECKSSLTPRGMYLNTVPTLGIVWHMLTTRSDRGRKARFTTAGLIQNRANFDFLAELFSAGHLHAVIDRCYPLAQAAEAHRYVDTGHKKGTVLLDMTQGT